MTDSSYPLFPIFAFVSFTLMLLPLPTHLQAWNIGTCSYMIWVALSCFIMFVDSVVWNGNTQDAPIWCDIVTKWVLGASVGIPASSLCIVRRLHKIATIKTATLNLRNKRGILVDLSMTAGLPVVVMILHVVVQGHRYDILEDFGCFPVTVNTLAAYPILYMWPVLLGCISFVYAGLAFLAFWKRRAQFRELLSSTPSLSVDRYLRLMILACAEMVCTVPLGIYSIYVNTYGVPLEPYISWENIHWGFNRFTEVPAAFWQSNGTLRAAVELSRWLYVACALLFVILFAFTEESRKTYLCVFWNTVSIIRTRKRSSATSPGGSASWLRGSSHNVSFDNTLPTYSPTELKIEEPTTLTSSTFGGSPDLEKALPSRPTTPNPMLTRSNSATSSTSTMVLAYTFSKTHNQDIPSSPISMHSDSATIVVPAHPQVQFFHVTDDYPTSPTSDDGISYVPQYHRPISPPQVYPHTVPYTNFPRPPSPTHTP